MIGSLRGIVAQIMLPNALILDVNGVGYLVHCPTDLLTDVKVDDPLSLVIHTSVREDAITLYGFRNSADKSWFEALRAAQGVGPSLALAILSSMSLDELSLAISNKDQASLTKVPGVGAKTASRLIVEMAGRLSQLGAFGNISGHVYSGDAILLNDVRLALTSLGYSSDQIRRVVDGIPRDLSLEEMIKYSLKELAS